MVNSDVTFEHKDVLFLQRVVIFLHRCVLFLHKGAVIFCYLRILHLLRITFYFSESLRVLGCNSIADLSLIVVWTHKFAVGTY